MVKGGLRGTGGQCRHGEWVVEASVDMVSGQWDVRVPTSQSIRAWYFSASP